MDTENPSLLLQNGSVYSTKIKKDGISKLVVLPLFPQFSISTSGSSLRLLESIFRLNKMNVDGLELKAYDELLENIVLNKRIARGLNDGDGVGDDYIESLMTKIWKRI